MTAEVEGQTHLFPHQSGLSNSILDKEAYRRRILLSVEPMNRKNPAVKRILADVRELQTHPSSRYFAQPLEDNMFEWHFTIRGPADTPFADGVYHGRILLPTDYPMKPPNIVFLTKNGRFEVGTKICLSISAYHEETWQPAWGVRTMLEAIISFMPTEGMGAIGALDWTPEERRKLATESKNFCCSVCGKAADLLSDPKDDVKAPAETTQPESDGQSMAEQVAQLHLTAAPAPCSPHVPGSSAGLMSDFLGANLGNSLEAALGAGEFAADAPEGGDGNDDTIGDAREAGQAPDMVMEGEDGQMFAAAGASVDPASVDRLTELLPDMELRMDDLQLTTDAQDNYDTLGLLGRDDVEQTVHGTSNTAGADVSVSAASSAAGTPPRPVRSGVDTASSTSGGTVPRSGEKASPSDLPSLMVGLRQRRAALASPIPEKPTTTVTTALSPARTAATTANTAAEAHTPSPVTNTSADREGEPSQAAALRQAALARIDHAREHIHEAIAQVQGHMQAIDERLAQAQAQDETGVGAAAGAGLAEMVVQERDAVDEWLGIVLVALGSSIMMMLWRIVTRYYTLFL